MGLRVQEKLEKLIEKHMSSIGATKVSLSTISSEKLWHDSGRLEGATELFRFKDRKGARYLLAPTHEEEITRLVAGIVFSRRNLPLRLFQIGRKYRDELRPRGGLLRGREFLMKDLYTFDESEADALRTYEEVQVAYKALFKEIGVPFLVAEADAGTMGGKLSHEYLFPSQAGEDSVVSCDGCGYTANTETVTPKLPVSSDLPIAPEEIAVHHSISTDRMTLVNTYYLKNTGSKSDSLPNEINLQKIKELVPEIDSSVGPCVELFEEKFVAYEYEMPEESYSKIVNLFDAGLPRSIADSSFSNHTDHTTGTSFITDKRIPTTSISSHPDGRQLQLVKIRTGDPCPRCDHGKLTTTNAIELGHTFHLGTRYTEPLKCCVGTGKGPDTVPMQQGCHGIGVSRMIPAVADSLQNNGTLAWPRGIAPYEVSIISYPEPEAVKDAEEVFDLMASRGMDGSIAGLDCVIDERQHKSHSWKVRDSKLIGIPVTIVMGKTWKKALQVEVVCPRKDYNGVHSLHELREVVQGLLEGL